MRPRKHLIACGVVLLAVLLIPTEAWVWTQVRHGESPKFSVPTSGSYCVTVVGYYTDRDNLTAAGVVTVKWGSSRSVKRQAELLGLRSAFLDWFIKEWIRQGGTRQQALDAILGSVDHIQKNPSNQPDPDSGYATPVEQCEGRK